MRNAADYLGHIKALIALNRQVSVKGEIADGYIVTSTG